MKYLEITVTTTTEGQELVADVLWEYSSYGVAVCDTNDILELIECRRETFDYIDEKLECLKPSTLVKGYIDQDFDVSIIEKSLQKLKERSVIDLGSMEVVKRIVDGDDWIEIWKKHYKPMEIGGIVVCPNWIECNTNKPIVRIDTCTAFGTGEHETTSMCIEFLHKYLKPDMTVMDIGTGSGILGIACAKLGVKKIFMTDIDLIAVQSAKHNAKINGVENCCEIVKCDLLEKAKGKCNLLVANITADILIRLSQNINYYLFDNSLVILSGIIHSKLQEVIDVFCSLKMKLVEKKTMGEWNALVLEKVSE